MNTLSSKDFRMLSLKLPTFQAITNDISVSFDKDAVNTLESSPHVQSVEADGEVKTQ